MSENHKFSRTWRCSQKGISLVEVLVVTVISSALMAVVVNIFINQRKTYFVQDQVAVMVQSAMAGLDLMKREIMIAGYDPTTLAGAGILAANASSVRFSMDITYDAGHDGLAGGGGG